MAFVHTLVVLVVAVSVMDGVIAYSIVSRGLSAHDEPSRAEEITARAMRRWATSAAMRTDALNPKTAAQWREEEEARRFLQGDSKEPSAETAKKGHRD